MLRSLDRSTYKTIEAVPVQLDPNQQLIHETECTSERPEKPESELGRNARPDVGDSSRRARIGFRESHLSDRPNNTTDPRAKSSRHHYVRCSQCHAAAAIHGQIA